MPAQPPLTPLTALSCQIRVQLFPAVDARNRNHEVPPCIADESLHVALVVALAWAPELVGEQIVALQLQECLRLRPFLAAKDPRHCDLGVVVEDARGNGAKIIEGKYVALLE